MSSSDVIYEKYGTDLYKPFVKVGNIDKINASSNALCSILGWSVGIK